MTTYLLDANTIIEPKNEYYGFDFCPAYWDWLREQLHKGAALVIQEVNDELLDDEVRAWADVQLKGLVRGPDAAVYSAYRSVADWVNRRDYTPASGLQIPRQGRPVANRSCDCAWPHGGYAREAGEERQGEDPGRLQRPTCSLHRHVSNAARGGGQVRP